MHFTKKDKAQLKFILFLFLLGLFISWFSNGAYFRWNDRAEQRIEGKIVSVNGLKCVVME